MHNYAISQEEKIKELELKVQQQENCCLQECFIEKKV